MRSDRYYIFYTLLITAFLSIIGILGIVQRYLPDLWGDIALGFLYSLTLLLALILFLRMSQEDNNGS